MPGGKKEAPEATRIRLKKGDTVKVIAGKDLGKTGKVLRVIPARGRLIVEGVNFVKRHARRTREDRAGGIHEVEASVHVSNVILICPKCHLPTRIGNTALADGTKVRVCRKCGEVIER
ncbi:MAG: 50S ribosomal protein L24 [candidate division Zixibacteria bacterium]|nr:50S ribosomal protein L24 [candidate division Zixibacteria bacterium]